MRSGFLVKLTMIAALCLLAEIPLWMIGNLIAERQLGSDQAERTVQAAWGGTLQVVAPYLAIDARVSETTANQAVQVRDTTLFISADDVAIDLSTDPQTRSKGLFDIVVFTAQATFEGTIQVPDAQEIARILGADHVALDIATARMVVEISDRRTLTEVPSLRINERDTILDWNTEQYWVSVDSDASLMSGPVVMGQDGRVTFNLAYRVQGSRGMAVLPTASETRVNLQSAWPSPSFTGAFLPRDHVVTDEGTTARWALGRNNLALPKIREFSQSRTLQADTQALAFGVKLIEPVSLYRMVERAVKYGLLFVTTTFVVYVLFETLGRMPIHIVHYGLVGAALSIFYVLLLSLAEVLGFAYAYLISTAAVVLQTGLFTRAITASWRRCVVFSGVLSAVYGYLYLLLDLEEMSLLAGSVGLFLLLSAAMFALRKLGTDFSTRTEPATAQ